jgi:hypothetical protein
MDPCLEKSTGQVSAAGALFKYQADNKRVLLERYSSIRQTTKARKQKRRAAVARTAGTP